MLTLSKGRKFLGTLFCSGWVYYRSQINVDVSVKRFLLICIRVQDRTPMETSRRNESTGVDEPEKGEIFFFNLNISLSPS